MSGEEGEEDVDPPKGWTDIKGIYYGFNDHCEIKTYPGIHKALRIGLADTTKNVDDYFTDKERTSFKTSSEVIRILRKSIADSITEEANETTKTERIEPITNTLPILFRFMDSANGIHQAREIKIKNARNLEEAFEVTRKNKGNIVSLVLDINSLHFKRGQKFRAKNFDHIGNEANPISGNSNNTSEDDSIDIEVEDTTGKEDPTTTSAMIDMMKKLVDTIASKEAANEARGFGPTNPSHTPISLKNFNIDSLQEDVRQRVISKNKEGYFMPHTEMVPYATEIPDMWRDPSGETMRTSISHFVAPNILATKDGHLFRAFTEKSIEKRFTHDVPEFDASQGTNPTTVRMWYHEFVKHGMGSGVYIHPYYCFRPGANSVHGFTCGTDTDNEQFDLPSAFAPALDRWSLLVATAIQGVFPKGSKERSICNHNVTDGYAALRNIIIPNHPSFHEHGPSMAIHPPLQSKKHDIFQHFDLYQDHLAMKAFTQNVSTDLETPDQLTNFILSCRFGDQILIKSRDERRSTDGMMKLKWGYGQITSTLASYLETVIDRTKPPFPNSIKSPRIPDPSPLKGSNGVNRRGANRFKGRKERDRSQPRTPQKPKTIKKVTINREDIEQVESLIPDVESPEDQYRVAIYRLGIHSIKKTGEFDVSQKCLVCKKAGHTFDECPVLNDHELLKKVHISFCSLCRRIQRQTEDVTPQTIHGVTVSDTEEDDHQSSSSEESYGESLNTYYQDESDFEPDFFD